MDNIEIRDATEDDLQAILDVYNESIPAGRSTADTTPVTVVDRLDWFRAFGGNRPIWVAIDKKEIVGCIYLTSFYGGRPAYNATAEVSTYIRSSHQRRGLGTFLKRKMIEACPKLGVENLISMYFDHNEGTRRMNEKFGFETAGHLREIATVKGEKRGLIIGLLRVAST